jgi:hypothetical protein
MAVTLTSTGITFSDNTSINSAEGLGGLKGAQTFYNSATWTRPSGVSNVMATVQGGAGGGYDVNVYGAGWTRGGHGGETVGVIAVNGNVAVTVGNGGNKGEATGYGNNNPNVGNASNFSNVQGGGGGVNASDSNIATQKLYNGGYYGKGTTVPHNTAAKGIVLVQW